LIRPEIPVNPSIKRVDHKISGERPAAGRLDGNRFPLAKIVASCHAINDPGLLPANIQEIP
jgi:hypothetical protein